MNPHSFSSVRLSAARGSFVGLALLLLVLAGCSEERPAINAALTGQISIKGSNTFGEELAPQLIAAYRRTRPNVTVDLESRGSGSGLAALLAGACDVATTSRNPTPDELAQARASGIELQEYVIGYYGVAVIVNQSNAVARLSRDQVREIFTGTVRNWKDVGGSDTEIHVYIRDPISGTNLGFRELAMENRAYAQGAKQVTTYPNLAAAVAQDAGGIGYASMNMAGEKGIKAVSIGGAQPNALSVNEGWYPYARMLRLYTNKARESAVARDFVLFVQREPGQRILENLGFVRRFEPRLKTLTPD